MHDPMILVLSSADIKLHLFDLIHYKYHLLKPQGTYFHLVLHHPLLRHHCQRHRHDFPEIVLVESGRGVHRQGRQSNELLPGHLIFIRPDDCHQLLVDESRGLKISNLALNPAWWKQFTKSVGDIRPVLTAKKPPCELLTLEKTGAILAELQSLDRNRENPLLLTKFVAGVLHSLRDQDSRAGSGRITDDWLQSAIERLRQEEDLSDGLHQLQKYAGRSAEHLARHCRKKLGMTPSAVVNSIRLERFQHLLLHSSDKIITLAGQSGFDHVTYLNRLFREQTGLSPREWKKRAGLKSIPV